MSGSNTVRVVHPAAEDRPQLVEAVPRPARAEGARVGLVDNARTNSDRFMQIIGQLLEEAGVGGVVIRRKPNPSLPLPDEAFDELLKRCDIVVHGVAD
ncbi:MAG: hypothetical protein HY726_22795 [Candidatus Rokubacteria bacterium]|nr:hypothetical protein [Candidatus Rokubacteria bacterium]